MANRLGAVYAQYPVANPLGGSYRILEARNRGRSFFHSGRNSIYRAYPDGYPAGQYGMVRLILDPACFRPGVSYRDFISPQLAEEGRWPCPAKPLGKAGLEKSADLGQKFINYVKERK